MNKHIIVAYIILILVCISSSKHGSTLKLTDDTAVYLNRIVVDTKEPNLVAKKFELKNLGRVFMDKDIFEMEFGNHPKTSKLLNEEMRTKVDQMRQDSVIKAADFQVGKRREVKSYDIQFTDPLWNETWFLNPDQMPDDPENSINGGMDVMGAWVEGMTGYGVRVAHIDDGIDYNHPDLRFNYDSSISTNIHESTDDPFELQVTWMLHN